MLASESKQSDRCLLIITSQSGKSKDRWGCEFRKESANDVFLKLLEQGRNRAYEPGHIRQGLEVVTKTIK